MKHLLQTLLSISLTLAVSAQERPGQAPSQVGPKRPPLPQGVQAQRDVEYVEGGGKRRSLDLYLPDDARKPMPVVVWIHGGAWWSGSKDNCPAIGLTTRGYAVASLNYRLSQDGIWPAQIHDCKAAIRWLRANAAKYNLDPKRFGVWGASAGGHLVAMLGTSGDVKALEGDQGNLKQSSRVQAVCDWFGPSDFVSIANAPSNLKHNGVDSPGSKLIGGPLPENKDKAAAASPITYVTTDDPPFLIMHGDQDMVVPLQQSEVLQDALAKAKVDSKLHVVKGAGHGFGGPDIQRLIAEFFDKHLKPGVVQ